MDLAELLEYLVLTYHKDIPRPQSLDIFTQGLACIGAEPRQKGNQCIYVWLLKQEIMHRIQ